MTPREYVTLFNTLIAWGDEEDTAREIIHDWMKEMMKEEEEEDE